MRNAVDRTIYLIEALREEVNRESVLKNLPKEQIDSISISRISKLIRNMQLIDDGYIWVNQIVNYQGGDNYAIRVIHPNLPETEGMELSTNTTDIKGNRPYEEELNGINKDGELFFEYYFKKMNSEKIAHKMTFAKLYNPYNWVVATGVYLDNVDELVEIETRKMQKTHTSQIIYSLLIVVCSILLSIVVLMVFDNLISRLICSYQADIKKYTNSLIEEKEKTEKALLEVKQLKGMLPICSFCKNIRNDEGYYEQIENYIHKHTGVDFSHTICNTCMKEHYPEEYESIMKDKSDN